MAATQLIRADARGARASTARGGSLALPPPAVTQAPDVMALLKAFRRRWLPAIGFGILGGILATVIAWFALPSQSYTATAVFRVSMLPPKIVVDTAEEHLDFNSYIRNQYEYIKSRFVLNAMLHDNAIAALPMLATQADPVDWLGERIQTSSTGEFLRVSMTGDDPNQLNTIVNGVSNAYIREVVSAERTARRKRFDDLKILFEELQSGLSVKRKQLENLGDALGSNNVDTVEVMRQEKIQTRETAVRQLMVITQELRIAETELEVKRKSLTPSEGDASPRVVSRDLVDQHVRQDPYVMGLDQNLRELAQQRVDLLKIIRGRRSDIAVNRVEGQLKSIQQELENAKAQLRPEILRKLEEARRLPVSPEIAALEERVAKYKRLEEIYKSEAEGLKDEHKEMNRSATDLEKLKEEIAHSKDAADEIGLEIVRMGLEIDAPDRVSLFEKAEAGRKMKDNRPLMAGVSGLGTFGMIVLAVSFLEFRARRIGSTEAVTWGLGMPLMGALPALPKGQGFRQRAAQERLNRARGLMLESVNAMRTVLLRLAADQGVRAVMVTSAVEGEGKTSLACHLASSLARAGRKTVLLDGDLRKPTVHRLFDLSREPGLSELLRGEAKVEEAIQAGPIEGLFGIIAAGRGDARAIEGLALGEVRSLIERLKDEYEFVVVDTAPILPVADSLLIGQYLDGAIFSILHDVSQVPKVYSAHERLRLVGIRNLGAVMTGVRGDSYASSYYYSSAYSQPVAAAQAEGVGS
jgi:capsular exopolysaccharide synthesis family protein